MDYIIELELLVIGIIITVFAVIGILHLYTKTRRLSGYFERIMDLLKYILGHV